MSDNGMSELNLKVIETAAAYYRGYLYVCYFTLLWTQGFVLNTQIGRQYSKQDRCPN